MKKYMIQSSIIDSELNNRLPVIVGVSGGVDSMVLLYALVNNDYTVIVCHVNHGLRTESDGDEIFVKNYAKKHHLIFESKKLDLKNAKNIQDTAHQERIKFFKHMGQKHKTFQIALAHHLDDQFEQHLIQIARGTDLETWRGIPSLTQIDDFKIIRPFINITKDDLIEYAKNHSIQYVLDSSNTSDKYLRNRIRNHVVPLLKKENPKLLLNYNENIKKLNDILEESSIKNLVNEIPKNTIDYLTFVDQNSHTQLKLLRYLIRLFNPSLDIPNPQLKMILKQLNQSGNNVRFNLLDNCWLVCNYGKIKVIEIGNQEPESIIINTFGKHPYGLNKTLYVTPEKKPYITGKALEICYNKATFPITARPSKPGDKINMDYGHKKVSRFFQDYKVPYHERIHQIIIEDKSQILGILSLGIASKCGEHSKQKIYIYEVDNA